jgi:vacuolar-type H+-ATPase subunit I/STV1
LKSGLSLALLRKNLKGADMFNAFEKVIELEKNGFTKKQSEALLKVSMDIMNQEFSTKHDLYAVKTDLQLELSSVRNELKADIASVRSELKEEISSVRSELKAEIASLRNELHIEVGSIRSDMNALGDRLTIRLGMMMATMMTIGLSAIFGMLQMR